MAAAEGAGDPFPLRTSSMVGESVMQASIFLTSVPGYALVVKCPPFKQLKQR